MLNQFTRLYTSLQIFNFSDRVGTTYPDFEIKEHGGGQILVTSYDGRSIEDENFFSGGKDFYSSLKFFYKVNGVIKAGEIQGSKIVNRFFSYANIAWRHQTNCASLAEYLKYGKFSNRNGHNFKFFFRSFTPYNGESVKIGTTLCISTLKKGFEEKLSYINKSLGVRFQDLLGEKNIKSGQSPLKHRAKKVYPISFKSFYNDFVQVLGDYHFVTCVALDENKQPLFLSQNGRNFGFEGLCHLPVYNLTSGGEILKESETPLGVYICS